MLGYCLLQVSGSEPDESSLLLKAPSALPAVFYSGLYFALVLFTESYVQSVVHNFLSHFCIVMKRAFHKTLM